MNVLDQCSPINEEENHLLTLPYQEQKGNFALKLMRKRLKELLTDNHLQYAERIKVKSLILLSKYIDRPGNM